MNFLRYSLLPLMLCISSHAGNLDPKSQEALEKTQKLLTTNDLRTGFLKNNPKAGQADAMVESLAKSPVQKQAIYDAAAKIFRGVASENNGDALQIQHSLMKATENPEAFFNSLSEENKKMIQKLSEDLGPKGKSKP